MGDNAVRLALGGDEEAVQIGDRLAVELVGGPGIELEIARGCGDIGLCLTGRLAGVAGFNRGQFRGIGGDRMRQPHQQATALERRHSAPFTRFKRRSPERNRQIDLRLPALGEMGEDDAVGRIDDRNGRTACGHNHAIADDRAVNDAIDGGGRGRTHYCSLH